MGRVVDILEHSLESIVGDGTLVLKRDYMMGMFKDFQEESLCWQKHETFKCVHILL